MNESRSQVFGRASNKGKGQDEIGTETPQLGEMNQAEWHHPTDENSQHQNDEYSRFHV